MEIETLVESRVNEFGVDEKRVPGDGVIIGYGMINGRIVYASIGGFYRYGRNAG